MSAEGKKINDGTSFQPTEPALCVNGCGFFGTAATMNLCSKCYSYRDVHVKQEQAASAKAAMDKVIMHQTPSQTQSQLDHTLKAISSSLSFSPSPSASSSVVVCSNRCMSCKKKVGVMGFQCRCGSTFCGTHRYPEKHGCTFDFKSQGREAIAKANPVVKADRMDQRI